MQDISRRAFLKAAVVGGAAAAISGVAAGTALATSGSGSASIAGSAAGSMAGSGSASIAGSAAGSAAGSMGGSTAGSMMGSMAAGSASGSASGSAMPEMPPLAIQDVETSDGSDIVVPSNFSHTYVKPTQGIVAYEEAAVADSDISDTVDCDVVICGMGLAGSTAALSAVQSGLQVVVLEKGDTPNGHGAQIGCVNSKMQMEAGAEVIDKAALVDDAMASMAYRCSRAIWQRFVDHSGEAIDWLSDTLQGACGDFGAQGLESSVKNGVTSWNALVGAADGMTSIPPAEIEAAAALGADVRYLTPAVQLVKADDGSVAGVIAKDADGNYIRFNATKGVVLATGGYEANWDMLDKCLDPRTLAVASWAGATPYDTGDGHMMGLAVGAAIDDYPHALMIDPGSSMACHAFSFYLMMGSGLCVNERGQRFMGTSVSPEFDGGALTFQPGAHCYNITCGTVNENVAAAYLQASDVDDLASQIGCDADTLQASIDAYNAAAASGFDEEFNADASSYASLDQPPYNFYDEGTNALVTVSGLKVNGYSQVLDENGNVINGLYAIGNVSGNMFNGYYPHHITGNSHGRCVTFGYLVGRILAGIDTDTVVDNTSLSAGSSSASKSGSTSASGSASGASPVLS